MWGYLDLTPNLFYRFDQAVNLVAIAPEAQATLLLFRKLWFN